MIVYADKTRRHVKSAGIFFRAGGFLREIIDRNHMIVYNTNIGDAPFAARPVKYGAAPNDDIIIRRAGLRLCDGELR